MLGEKVQEVSGKVIGTRVLPGEGGSVILETSFEATGKLLGLEIHEHGTYTSKMRPSGHLFGEGCGITITKDGAESATWRGFGVGKPTGKGMGASYRYSVSFQTASPKLARLNGMVLVGEWEIDEQGNAKGSAFEWR
jgi:hypothetical protein